MYGSADWKGLLAGMLNGIRVDPLSCRVTMGDCSALLRFRPVHNRMHDLIDL